MKDLKTQNTQNTRTTPGGDTIRPLYTKKWFGCILLFFGIFGVLLILHRIFHYTYEYDPQYTPIDYGPFNQFAYFTVLSNLLVCFYLITMSLGIFGSRRAQKIAFNPTFGACVTTYIVVTGVVYCCGIPLGFTTPFTWDNATHWMLSFIQIYLHMIIPSLMIILWLLPASSRKADYKKCCYSAIYPFIYSIFTMLRGAFIEPTFFPYPFFNPQFMWDLFFSDRPINLAATNTVIFILVILGMGAFILITMLNALIHNKLADKYQKK